MSRPYVMGRDLIAAGVPMLRWQVAGSMFAGVVMLSTCLCQASGKALPALVLSLSRQGVVFLLVLLLASAFFGYRGILAAQCAADILSTLLALFILRSVLTAREEIPALGHD